MKFNKLGSSGLDVSEICLGTMTWGRQNSQKDADLQIDYALAQGINFMDTAEMYAIPPTPETYGKTEAIIGDWLSRHPEKRKEIVLATKIAGSGLPWIRGGGDITGEAVIAAVDASLQRLQTDYIDLYQLHWPNRTSPHFSKHWPDQIKFTEASTSDESANMLEVLQALQECVQAGKIRYCGLSDETTWGISEYLRLSEKHNLPRMVSIQNEFSLLHAKDWPYLIEHCVRTDVAYLPWSPLGGGVLSGKYLNGARPAGSRWSIQQRNGLFRDSESTQKAVAQYAQIAKEIGMTPAQLALVWCKQVNGVTSTIIGATSIAQLEENVNAFGFELDEEAFTKVMSVYKTYPVPF